MINARRSAVVFYSPPLRVVEAVPPRWEYETLVVNPDGSGRRYRGGMSFSDADGRMACAAHVLAQLKVDREAARRSHGNVALVAVVDLASWDDLCGIFGAGDRVVHHHDERA